MKQRIDVCVVSASRNRGVALLRVAPLCALLLSAFLASCTDSDGSLFTELNTLNGCVDDNSCAANPSLEIGGPRPAQVQIPSDYDTSKTYPLLVVLHGFRASGVVQANYMGFNPRVDSKQFVLVMPDGTANETATRFWNATPACCAAAAAALDGSDNDYTTIDDVAYIRGLIEEAAATYSIDSSRVGLFGHSNGGFMALRLACEASDLVTSVVSLAGSTFAEASSCVTATQQPVSVLAVHGDADDTIFYDGQDILGRVYPGAVETTRRFATLAGCDSDNTVAEAVRDVDASIDGEETSVLAHTGCMPGVDVKLWTIAGGPHIPLPWASAAQDAFVDWIIDHPR